MLDFGMPMGPLRLIDEVGLDVAQDVAATLAAAFPDHMRLPAILKKMIAAKLLGRKSGGGFYTYEKGKTSPNATALALREAYDAASMNRATMRRRMALLMVNEAARCLEENIVAEPADVDFGMIMGAGFAPFRGGPLRYADTLGAAEIATELRVEAEHSGPYLNPCHLLEQMSLTNRRFYAGS
jgi:3-hydroxyacyl-CoA dehydrogenase/enoyl-CoA hydratase/3-hydroxybutyryl-CoA epimerase